MKKNYKIETFEDITPEIKSIRDEVFIKEQGIPEAEEYKDDEAIYTHFCLYSDGKPVACTRMRIRESVVKIMCVAVLQDFRKIGLGNMIMAFTERTAKKRGCKRAVIHAQVKAKGFYEKLGYKVEGREFIESDISYIKMIKKL